MEQKEYCIYYHKSPKGQYYIGQTCQDVEKRWRDGCAYYSNKFNKEVIDRNGGWEAFEHGILEEHLSSTEADKREAYYISLYNSVDNGFNTYNQNYNGYHFADLWADKDIRNEIIVKLKEQRNTAEYKQQQSQNMKNIWEREEYREKQKKTWTEGRREKVSEKSKKRWEDDEYREKISNAVSERQKENWKNPDYRLKKCKRVRCVETGQVFESLVAAAEWCGVKANTLCAALSSKTHQSGKHPETGEKVHWERYPAEVGKEG